LEAGEFHFHASNAQWLVINGSLGQFQGTGRVEESNHLYGFRLTVIDGASTSGPDMFRLRIWDIDDGYAIVYDNEIGSPSFAAPTTPISKGSVKIKTKK